MKTERDSGKTLYRVTFYNYMNQPFRLDTTDQDKIGPWLAEMFGMFPYRASRPTSVQIDTVENFS